MLGNLTDWTLILHAVTLIILGIMILRAAHVEHNLLTWRRWPPALLTIWGVSELADGAIYLRRWLSQETDIEQVRYESTFSFVLNLVSLIAIVLLIWRIRKGDIDEAENKDDRDRRQDQRSDDLDTRAEGLDERGAEMSREMVRLHEGDTP